MRNLTILRAFSTAVIILAVSSTAQAAAMVPGFNASSLGANDDGSTGSLGIGFTVNFYGNNYSSLYANNNGNATFDAPHSTYTPFPLNTTTTPIIAPFFSDVDTRGSGSDLLRYGSGSFDGHTAFGVTWDGVGVGYYYFHTNKLNKFQLLLVDRSDINAGDFDIVFNYDQIQWETGDASGGSNGLGGASARAGYANGTTNAGTYYELPGSAVPGSYLDSGPAGTSLIHNRLNSDVDGRYIFRVRNGEVQTVVPEPISLVVWGINAVILAGYAWRRRKAML